MASEKDLNLEATELRLGLPGNSDESAKNQTSATPRSNKRALPQGSMTSNIATTSKNCDQETGSHTKAQVVGWPPIRSYRKNSLQAKKSEAEISGIYVKVSMDGAPYLRKIDMKVFKGYPELLKALEDMFKFKAGEYSKREGYNGSEFVPTYEDKDGDWMLVGDVPWEMFTSCCKKLRIMKGSEARGLGCVV
ncbi:indole-3-acetic acid inducible 4, AUXIN INDUCIBLE 2-11 [Hibiscus trionum]|uniref:Auxin-responsive protein n=1 Tax=Hibiscus trionum TaxID=183268 RepID=A0A9W7HUD5_HIBTR|nr:indole-3-acetic acid inducible 4, AUXIN INDUCIBLE 2-11 [Hibiscus trionum]